jgi:hypothetical protein
MKLQRHIVSGPSSSLALVQIGESGEGDDTRSHVRAVFQSLGEGRKKAAFSCSSRELSKFLRVIGSGRIGETALVTLSGARGFLEAFVVDSGDRRIRYEIHASRSRGGTKGTVYGNCREEPVRTRGQKGATS